MGVLEKKYGLDDISVGMEVADVQLSRIFDTYIILDNTRVIDNRYMVGKIAYIVNELSKETDDFLRNNQDASCIFHDSMDYEGDVTYDE